MTRAPHGSSRQDPAQNAERDPDVPAPSRPSDDSPQNASTPTRVSDSSSRHDPALAAQRDPDASAPTRQPHESARQNPDLVTYPPYGDYESDCPARMGVDLFGNSWLPVIVYMLRDGPMRPGELRTAIGGISQKMLTQTLRRMEQLTLVHRRRYAEAPPRVEYQLTEAGRDLLGPIYALGEWVDKHGRAVNAALAGEQD
ncbi:winged helix-turn-helix transcriptional regulator [Nocardia amikacinitolerans]|uniref:winged helix-turn-helix transcriptional regulator n=2 Tax=Nocardia amikacinitolerans TaxID=756689 RepID=UPI0020A4AD23|nr:winged helix-turn-helix transcriptional regulator [Nocardia amikacinitolerans]MCP2290347.1 transcriptional regulator, HxlR family [Nocardia amikacinitolerans]